MLLFSIIVSTGGVLSTISCSDKVDELKAEVAKVESLIGEEKEKNKELSEILATLNEQIEEDFASFHIHDDAIKSGTDREIDLLFKYREDLIEKYVEEGELIKDIEELELWTNLHRNKLDLLKQEHDLFVARRNEGADVECQKLMSNSTISTRSLRRSSDDQLVYSILLKRLETDLTYAKRLHAQLQKKVEWKTELRADMRADWEGKITANADGLAKAGNAVARLKMKVDKTREDITRLQATVYGLEKRKKSIEAQTNQVVADLKDYEQDAACFKTMTINAVNRRQRGAAPSPSPSPSSR